MAALCVATSAVWALESTLFVRTAAAQRRIPVRFGYGDEISRLGEITDREVADALKAAMGHGVAVAPCVPSAASRRSPRVVEIDSGTADSRGRRPAREEGPSPVTG